MKCKEIMKVLEEHWPAGYALEWDNVGLLVGREEKEVTKIFVCLDVTEETLSQAVEWGADMIVSHHPLLFSAVKKITDRDFIGRRILKLVSADISCFAMHTNFDVAGMALLNQESLGLLDSSVLMVTDKTQEQEMGIGRIGRLEKEMTLRELAEFVKERLGISHVSVYGDLDSRITRVAVSGGSGKSAVKPAQAGGAQVLVTGDIDYHTGIDAVAAGVSVIDAGHYGTESVFIPYVTEKLGEWISEVEVKGARIEPPFQTI